VLVAVAVLVVAVAVSALVLRRAGGPRQAVALPATRRQRG
jgi:hypothetical protein